MTNPTPTYAARPATEADDEAIQAIWAQAEAMRLAIQKAAHDIRATLNLSGMGLTQKAEDDFQTIIIDALAKCPAPTRLLDELATVRGERDTAWAEVERIQQGVREVVTGKGGAGGMVTKAESELQAELAKFREAAEWLINMEDEADLKYHLDRFSELLQPAEASAGTEAGR